LQPFVALNLSFVGKAGLKTLTDVEIIPSAINLQGLAVYCGFYVNELTGLFCTSTTRIRNCSPVTVIVFCGCPTDRNWKPCCASLSWELFGYSGYGLQLAFDDQEQPVQIGMRYHYDTERGLIADQDGLFSGKALQAIDNKDFSDPQVLSEAKLLMRTAINSHLQGRPLKSRTVINQIIKQL